MNKNIVGFYFSGYKSFPPSKIIEISPIKNVNVLIGKNNCGKSSILDILGIVMDFQENHYSRKNVQGMGIDVRIDIDDLEYDPQVSRNEITNKIMRCSIVNEKRNQDKVSPMLEYLKGQEGHKTINNSQYDLISYYFNNVAEKYADIFPNYKFRRLNAERDIKPESEFPSNGGIIENKIILDEFGSKTSLMIRNWINIEEYDEKLIERDLLKNLNQIMFPESVFSEIRIQEDGYKKWEIYLEEENSNGRIPLSKSGSGLKTIILVLLNLLIIPEMKEYKDKKIVYAFEEIENNLHPALQRKIFEFIYTFAVEKDVYVFLTTHSHVAINSFYGKEKAQIIHVERNENGESTAKLISNYMSKTKILEDLDVKASDLLQSNGIIWVEGPSDRIYIKKWLEVFCGSKYEEGLNYQFLYYGGRLLSHYEAQPEENETVDLINILLTNRNSAIVIDSDKRNEDDNINSTKTRVKTEFEQHNLFCWITKGKEIENYLSKDVLNEALEIEMEKSCEQYELFPDYMESTGKFKDKVPFARTVAPKITKENSKDMLDLKSQIEKLYSEIEKWNK